MRRTIHRGNGKGLVYEEPKTSRSRRTLELPVHFVPVPAPTCCRAPADRLGTGGMMIVMRGGAGGSGNDEVERARSTWLDEDDEVQGQTDAPPSVIR